MDLDSKSAARLNEIASEYLLSKGMAIPCSITDERFFVYMLDSIACLSDEQRKELHQILMGGLA